MTKNASLSDPYQTRTEPITILRPRQPNTRKLDRLNAPVNTKYSTNTSKSNETTVLPHWLLNLYHLSESSIFYRYIPNLCSSDKNCNNIFLIPLTTNLLSFLSHPYLQLDVNALSPHVSPIYQNNRVITHNLILLGKQGRQKDSLI